MLFMAWPDGRDFHFFVGFSEESKIAAFVSKALLGCGWKQRVH